MFFHLTGIKDISDKNYTLEFLIEGHDLASVKTLLSEQKVIILGLEHYTQDPRDFWDTYLDVESKNGVFRVVGAFERLEEFVAYAMKLHLKIVGANSYTAPISLDKVQRLIESAYQKEKEDQEIQRKIKEKQERKTTLNFNDKKLKKAYNAIEQIINQIDQVLEIGGKNILPMTKKKLDDMRWEISKLRLATNYDKIIEELHKAMNLIVETQDYLLERLESDKVFIVVPQSKITNVQVIREQTRLAKAQLLSALGAQLSKEETMYVSLGYLKLFTEYLHQDLAVVLENKLSVVRQIFNTGELALLFVLVELAILAVFAENLGIGLTLQEFWVLFIYIASLALIFRLVNEYLHPQKLSIYLWILGGIMVVYVLWMAFLKFILVF